MLNLRKPQRSDGLASSKLLNQDSFYEALEKDLAREKHVVIIESPFISRKRLRHLLPIFRKLAQRKVRIIINTKPPIQQEEDYGFQAEECIVSLQELGAAVIVTGTVSLLYEDGG